jgi:hypothetical protein
MDRRDAVVIEQPAMALARIYRGNCAGSPEPWATMRGAGTPVGVDGMSSVGAAAAIDAAIGAAFDVAATELGGR